MRRAADVSRANDGDAFHATGQDASQVGSSGPFSHRYCASHAETRLLKNGQRHTHPQEIPERVLPRVQDEEIAVVSDGRQERHHSSECCTDDERLRRQA